MQNQDKKVNKNKLFILPIVLIIPAVFLFDLLIYLFTRPTCLQCGNLLEFMKTGSLTIFLLTSVGYQLTNKK